jgi:hypothetical protein
MQYVMHTGGVSRMELDSAQLELSLTQSEQVCFGVLYGLSHASYTPLLRETCMQITCNHRIPLCLRQLLASLVQLINKSAAVMATHTRP